MKSTKYQLLKGDFDFACRELRKYREIIEQQKEEIEQIEKVSDYNADMRMKYEKALKDITALYKDTDKPVLDQWGMFVVARKALEE